MLEKTVETYLVDRVRAAGGDAYKFSSPARVSVPDRIVVFPPARIYFVELKRPGGVVTKGQLREHERLRALGCDVRVIDSREAVDVFVREASAAPAPYLHVYEYSSPFGGTHREFAPNTWNGQRPARAVPLYTTPQPAAYDGNHVENHCPECNEFDSECTCADASAPRAYPDEMSAELRDVLGRPNFWCGPIAHEMRAAGTDIRPKAEDEQAHVLHWLVKLVLTHGTDWKKAAATDLRAIREAADARRAALAGGAA